MEWSVVFGAAVGGVIGLAGPVISHFLRQSDRLAEVRERNADEQMAAWARLHDEAARGCSRLQYASDITEKYGSLLKVFLLNMHLFQNEVREELWEQLQQLGTAVGGVLAAGSDPNQPDQLGDRTTASIQKFNEVYQVIYQRHLNAAKDYFSSRVE